MKGTVFCRSSQFKKGSMPWNKGTKGIMKENSGSFKKGANHRNFKGKIMHKGYYLIFSPNHPFRDKGNYVKEHRLVMEKHIGRYLSRTEVVHHINHVRSDNRIENLMLIKNNSEHRKLHPPSDETRAKISASNMGKIPWNKGIKISNYQ